MKSPQVRPALPTPDAEQREKIAKRLALASRDRSDTGSVLPSTRVALALGVGEDAGAARLEALVAALAIERVIVPVEVSKALVESDAPGEKHGAIDFVRTGTPAGDALVVYSSKEELAADRPQDRPMAYDCFRVALAALIETGGRIVVDPGSAAVVLPRPAVAALAQHDEWLPAWKDSELLEELRGLAGVGRDGIAEVRVVYAGAGLVRVEVLVDAASGEGPLRTALTAALGRIGASKRLIAAADRVELAPRLVRLA